jgi:hypothetical protein
MSLPGASIILENPADVLHKCFELLVCCVVSGVLCSFHCVARHNSIQRGGYPLYWCAGFARVARNICNIWYSSITFHLSYASRVGYRCGGFTHQVSSSYPLNQQFLLLVLCSRYSENPKYSGITSIKSPPFCMAPSSASLTNLRALLSQSRDCSCYVSRTILASPPLWLQKYTDIRAYDSSYSLYLWHQPRLSNVTCVWSWRLCGINPAILPAVWCEWIHLQWLHSYTCSLFIDQVAVVSRYRINCYLLLYTVTPYVWILLFLVWCDFVCFVFKCVSAERRWSFVRLWNQRKFEGVVTVHAMESIGCRSAYPQPWL